METLLTDLKVLNEDVKLAIGNYSSLAEIGNACEKAQTKTISNNTIALSQTDRLRKHNNYVSKIKTCTKLYMNLNEQLLKKLKVSRK